MTDTIRLDRSDVCDTSDMQRIVFMVDAEQARSHGTMPDKLGTILGRLVMGQAVQRSDMAECGVHAMRLYDMDELKREGPPDGGEDRLQHRPPTLTLVEPHGVLAALPGPGGGGSKGNEE